MPLPDVLILKPADEVIMRRLVGGFGAAARVETHKVVW